MNNLIRMNKENFFTRGEYWFYRDTEVETCLFMVATMTLEDVFDAITTIKMLLGIIPS